MSDKSIIFFLSSAIIFLIAVIVYQRMDMGMARQV